MWMHPFCQLCSWWPLATWYDWFSFMFFHTLQTPANPSPVKSSPKSSPKLFVCGFTNSGRFGWRRHGLRLWFWWLASSITTFTTERKAVLSLSSYIEKICGQWKKFSTSLNSDRKLSRLDSVIVRTGTALQQHQGNLKNLLFWVALNNSLLIQTCLKQTISWPHQQIINTNSRFFLQSKIWPNVTGIKQNDPKNRKVPLVNLCLKVASNLFYKTQHCDLSEALQNHIGPWVLARHTPTRHLLLLEL